MSRTLLFGHHYDRFERNLGLLFAAGLLLATFIAYAVGVFQVSGGVIFLPADATLVGFVAAVGIGFRRGGLLFAWLAQFAAYAGFRAEWVGFGLTGHSLVEGLAALLAPTRLFVLGAAMLGIGTTGFAIGYLGRWSSKRFKEWARTAKQNDG